MGRIIRTVERAAFTVGTALVASGAALGITDPHNPTAEVMVGTGTAATIAVAAAGAIQYAALIVSAVSGGRNTYRATYEVTADQLRAFAQVAARFADETDAAREVK